MATEAEVLTAARKVADANALVTAAGERLGKAEAERLAALANGDRAAAAYRDALHEFTDLVRDGVDAKAPEPAKAAPKAARPGR